MKKTALAIAAIMMTAPVAAQVHRCPAPDGSITYSQHACPHEEGTVILNTGPLFTASARHDHESIARACIARGAWKDPESVRIERVGTKFGADVITWNDVRVVARSLPIWVNAKNSYGGYTGTKMHLCWLAQHDDTVLRLDSF